MFEKYFFLIPAAGTLHNVIEMEGLEAPVPHIADDYSCVSFTAERTEEKDANGRWIFAGQDVRGDLVPFVLSQYDNDVHLESPLFDAARRRASAHCVTRRRLAYCLATEKPCTNVGQAVAAGKEVEAILCGSSTRAMAAALANKPTGRLGRHIQALDSNPRTRRLVRTSDVDALRMIFQSHKLAESYFLKTSPDTEDGWSTAELKQRPQQERAADELNKTTAAPPDANLSEGSVKSAVDLGATAGAFTGLVVMRRNPDGSVDLVSVSHKAVPTGVERRPTFTALCPPSGAADTQAYERRLQIHAQTKLLVCLGFSAGTIEDPDEVFELQKRQIQLADELLVPNIPLPDFIGMRGPELIAYAESLGKKVSYESDDKA